MKKKILIGIIVLIVLGFCYFAYEVVTYGKYRLSPGATTTIKIEKNETLEAVTELYIRKIDGDVLELLGSSEWTDADNKVYFDVEKQAVLVTDKTKDGWNLRKRLITTGNANGIQLTQEGISISYKGERKFYMDIAEETTVTIQNLSDHSVYFEAYVIYR